MLSLSKASEGPWERSRKDAFTCLKPEYPEKCSVLETLDSPSGAHFWRPVGRSCFDDSLLLNSSHWAVPSGKGGRILFTCRGCPVPQGLSKRFFCFFSGERFQWSLSAIPKGGRVCLDGGQSGDRGCVCRSLLSLSWFPPRSRYVIWGGREFSPRPLERLKHKPGFQLKSQNLSSLSAFFTFSFVSVALIPLTPAGPVGLRIQELGWGCGAGFWCASDTITPYVYLSACAVWQPSLSALIAAAMSSGFCGQLRDCWWIWGTPSHTSVGLGGKGRAVR